MTEYGRELEIAVAAVRQAATVCQAVQRSLVTADTLTKKDRSPVTVADFASQAVVCQALGDAFAGDLIVGEENARQLREDDQVELRGAVARQVCSLLGAMDEKHVLGLIDRGGATPTSDTRRFWTLDPIDGTKGFLRGEQYAIALALIERGQVVLGVLACPNLPLNAAADKKETGVLMTAVLGKGVEVGRIYVEPGDASHHPLNSQADVRPRFCESVESGHSDQGQAARIAAALGITAAPLRMDSQVKYAVVARGEASIYLRLPTRAEYRENIWDHAAGSIIVEQAGGTVTDIAGEPLDFSQGRTLARNRGIIATRGTDHGAVVAAVRQVVG